MATLTLISKSPKELDLLARLEPVVESLKYQHRDVEILGSDRSPIVRVVLDHADRAIGIEDCSQVHEIIGPMFDVWDPFPGAYSLEVTSPGESPTLRTWSHFEKAVGGRVHVETQDPLPMPAPAKPRKRFDSILKELRLEQGVLVLEDALGVFEISVKNLRKAEWLRDWSPQVEKSPIRKEKQQPRNPQKHPRRGV